MIEKLQNHFIERNMTLYMECSIGSEPIKDYNILLGELVSAKHLHAPTKVVKFNNRKHKL